MTEQVKAGGADTGAVDQTELRKRLDEQAAELAELKKKAGEVDELRKRADEAETIAKAERELRLEAEFTKRAEDELPALAGPPLVKGRMLRRIVERTLSADEAVKKQAEAELTVLKAANEAATATYRPIGKAGRPENGGSPAAELDERAEALAKEKAITKRDAMVAIVRSDADLAARLKSEVH